MNPVLLEMIARCGEWLQAECIRRVGSIHVYSDQLDAQKWHQPPLRLQASIDGIELDQAVRLLYSPNGVRLVDVINAWTYAVPLINGHKRAAREVLSTFSVVFPGVPFTIPAGLDVRACLVQFLAAAAWHHGELRLSAREAVLTLPDKTTLALYEQGIEWPGGYRRLRHPLRFSPITVARSVIGGTKASLTNLGAVYRHLASVMPELTVPIEVVFALATWAGRSAEQRLIDLFDVQRRGDDDIENTDDVKRLLEMQQLIGAAR